MPDQNHLSLPDACARLKQLAADWTDITANERSVFQAWLIRFCDALGVDAPEPPSDHYRFELPVHIIDREGRESINYIDCWKAGHFALEAKASGAGSAPLGARDDALLRKAFGQVRNYVAHVSGDAPPYLMVVDVPRTLIVWDRWSGAYGDYAAGRRIALATLHERPDDVALLYDIFQQPQARDPRGRAQAVTTQIAAGLAELAAELEQRGYDTERVARFLMRCVFSCFAEDVGLLPDQLFRRTLETARASGDHERLESALTLLWRTMDSGGMFGAELLHRFNGHFFKTVEALPLQARDVELLIDASKHDWARVEPSIFGTLLVRALDPEERHRLGAEYTPRAYIERLVEPTVVEPIRERWTAVQGAVLQLEATGKKRDAGAAVAQLREFHAWMRGLSFLDPACGSGNFLYVTMAAVKRIELEVLNEIQRLSGGQGGLVLDEVHPRQFHGIEVKPWAREIAELTLWIGYHQFWRESHGGRTPPDPILEDTGTIECRDAVLAWDAIVHRPEKDRPDPTPRLVSPVTGEMVPDPAARLPYYEYVGARQAEWPRADFIVGNPPYIGRHRIRDALGDGYVDALRALEPALTESVDLVMYWWVRAAREVLARRSVRFGLITTNSITQGFNSSVVQDAIGEGLHLIFAVADHPWIDSVQTAAIRVSMMVGARGETTPVVLLIVDEEGHAVRKEVASIHANLSSGADIQATAKVPLLSNAGLSFRGVQPQGNGFIIGKEEADSLLADSNYRLVIRPHLNGRDLMQRPADSYIIDFGLESREFAERFPRALGLVMDRVKPDRDANARASYRLNWWRLGEPRRALRQAITALGSKIVTAETAAHRVFMLLAHDVSVDNSVIVIASEERFVLGVLSGAIHNAWAHRAGTRLGVGNTDRYNNPLCFDPFPFPDSTSAIRTRIATLAEQLDTHRKSAIARDVRVTMTGMYNVVDKLRSATPLTTKERTIHELAACGVLRDLHDELDALVADAYGWPWPMEKEEILERLVALHDERVEEEKRGLVRWLRPNYQIPRFGADLPSAPLELVTAAVAAKAPDVERRAWPASAVEQFAAIGALAAQRAVSVDDATASFTGARREHVERHLETLALMGEVTRDADGRYQAARKVA